MSVNVTEYESTLWHDGLRIRILLYCRLRSVADVSAHYFPGYERREGLCRAYSPCMMLTLFLVKFREKMCIGPAMYNGYRPSHVQCV